MRLLHGDFHVWNVLVHRGQLAAIDFEDLMWGWPIQDIGTAFYYLFHRPDFAAVRDGFRRGYEQVSPWPEAEPGDLETFIAGRALVLANDVLQMAPETLADLDVPRVLRPGGAAAAGDPRRGPSPGEVTHPRGAVPRIREGEGGGDQPRRGGRPTSVSPHIRECRAPVRHCAMGSPQRCGALHPARSDAGSTRQPVHLSSAAARAAVPPGRLPRIVRRPEVRGRASSLAKASSGGAPSRSSELGREPGPRPRQSLARQRTQSSPAWRRGLPRVYRPPLTARARPPPAQDGRIRPSSRATAARHDPRTQAQGPRALHAVASRLRDRIVERHDGAGRPRTVAIAAPSRVSSVPE